MSFPRVAYPAEDIPATQGDDPCGALSLCCPAYSQAGQAEARAGHHELIGGEAAADPGGMDAQKPDLNSALATMWSMAATGKFPPCIQISLVLYCTSKTFLPALACGRIGNRPWDLKVCLGLTFPFCPTIISSGGTFKLMFLDTLEVPSNS